MYAAPKPETVERKYDARFARPRPSLDDLLRQIDEVTGR